MNDVPITATPPIALSIAQVQAITGLGRTKLFQLLSEGKLAGKKCGQRTLIMREDLELFLSSLEAYPTKKGSSHA